MPTWLRDSLTWLAAPANRIVQHFHCAAGWHLWEFQAGDNRRTCSACGVTYPPA
jgi:hypothetical protein